MPRLALGEFKRLRLYAKLNLMPGQQVSRVPIPPCPLCPALCPLCGSKQSNEKSVKVTEWGTKLSLYLYALKLELTFLPSPLFFHCRQGHTGSDPCDQRHLVLLSRRQSSPDQLRCQSPAAGNSQQCGGSCRSRSGGQRGGLLSN